MKQQDRCADRGQNCDKAHARQQIEQGSKRAAMYGIALHGPSVDTHTEPNDKRGQRDHHERFGIHTHCELLPFNDCFNHAY